MPRYSIPNVPTAIDFYYQDPGNFCVQWGICDFPGLFREAGAFEIAAFYGNIYNSLARM